MNPFREHQQTCCGIGALQKKSRENTSLRASFEQKDRKQNSKDDISKATQKGRHFEKSLLPAQKEEHSDVEFSKYRQENNASVASWIEGDKSITKPKEENREPRKLKMERGNHRKSGRWRDKEERREKLRQQQRRRSADQIVGSGAPEKQAPS
jgi:hypothetical protein